MSSLEQALEAATDNILGPVKDTPAVQELLRQAPNANIFQRMLVRTICEGNPQASQDVKILEDELRDPKNTEIILKRTTDSTQGTETNKKLCGQSKESDRKYSNLISVYVGPMKEVFHVHKSYLIKIPYFAKYLDGFFRESGCSSVTSPDDNPQAFQRVLDYLYTGEVSKRVKTIFASQDEHASQVEALLVMETYVLGDKLCMEEFANKTMDMLRVSYQNFTPDAEEMLFAVEKGNLQLKDMILRIAAATIIRDGWDKYMSYRVEIRDNFFGANIKNAEDLARVIVDNHEGDNPAYHDDGCEWHIHVHTPRCSSAKEW